MITLWLRTACGGRYNSFEYVDLYRFSIEFYRNILQAGNDYL